MKVFVTDAGYKHALAAIRSLGRKGIYVIAGAHRRGQSFYSKYCRERIIYPDPADGHKFAEFMIDYVRKNHIDVLLPIGYLSCVALSQHVRDLQKYVKIPLADYEAMQIAGDKTQTMQFARTLGVATPKNFNTPDEVDRFPIVVKGNKESGHVAYVNSREELSRIDTSDSVLQEYIIGGGYGYYALYNKGTPRAIFMHKRIREFPTTGGASTAAMSFYDPQLRKQGETLLSALNWHGVAMVEFKKDIRDGKYRLMEINPKFWGSLDLSIACGVDFPNLATKMAMEGDIETVEKYPVGLRFRWPFPDDFIHLLANPKSARDWFSDFIRKNTKSNLSISDPVPNLYQLANTICIVPRLIKSGKLKHPHGLPEPNREF